MFFFCLILKLHTTLGSLCYRQYLVIYIELLFIFFIFLVLRNGLTAVATPHCIVLYCIVYGPEPPALPFAEPMLSTTQLESDG